MDHTGNHLFAHAALACDQNLGVRPGGALNFLCDLTNDIVQLFYAVRRGDRYAAGAALADSVNARGTNTYGPMLDWSQRGRFTFSGQRPDANAGAADLYVVGYRIK